MAIVGAALAVGSAIAGAAEKARIEAHIQDRIATYSTFPNEKLLAIINTYGGEMAEAARRVLATRPGSTAANVATAAAAPPPVSQSAPASAAPVGGANTKVLLIAGVGALILFLALRR